MNPFRFLLLLAFLALAGTVVRADDDNVDAEVDDDELNEDDVLLDEEEEELLEIDEQEEELDDLDLVPSDLVETSYMFVDKEDELFPAGSEVTCLIGFNNLGETPFVVHDIEASFRHPEAF